MDFPKNGNVDLNQFKVGGVAPTSNNNQHHNNKQSQHQAMPKEGTKDFNQLIGEYAIRNRDKLETKGNNININDNTKSPDMFVNMEILNSEGSFTLKQIFDKAREQFPTSRISDPKLKVLIINTANSYKRKNIIGQKENLYFKK